MVQPLVSSAAAQNVANSVPASDARNTQIVTTNTRQPLPNFPTLDAWQKRRTALRNQILVSTGLSPLPPKNDLHAQVFGKVEGQGYTIEKVLLETFPGFYLGGNLYRPVNGRAKHPGIVSPHGHWGYGRLENQPVFSGPSLGISLARQGYVVFAYDMVGYTDTLQIPHRFGSAEMRLWGLGPLGLQLWNSIRAVDFVASLPDVDADDIGATGASGGASQTFLLAAVDERIHFSAPVNMISSFKQGGDLCENQAGLRIGTNNVELAAITAPRPMLMVSDTKDWTRNTLRDEYPAIHSIYALYGKPDAVEAVQIEAPHNFNRESREAVYRFFAKLHPGLSDPKDLVEHDISIPPLGDLMALYNHSLPANAIDLNGFFAAWQAMSRAQNLTLHDESLLRERLRQTLAVEIPTHVDAAQEGDHLVLSRGHGDRLQAVRIKGNGKGPIQIVIDAAGSASALEGETVAALRKQKCDVLVLDVFQTGAAKATRDRDDHPAAAEDPGTGGGPMFLTYNVSDDQARVQDVLTAIAYAQQLGRKVKIHASGDAALWALFADAVLDAPVEQVTENMPELRSDEDYLQHFNVPGIERAGGVEVARQFSAKKFGKHLGAKGAYVCDPGCTK
jgi:dienelactone hydrolase